MKRAAEIAALFYCRVRLSYCAASRSVSEGFQEYACMYSDPLAKQQKTPRFREV